VNALRILVVGPSWVGDTVLAQPLFIRLHEILPGLELDVLAPPWTAPLLARMPQVHSIIDHPFRHGELKLFARRRLGRALRAGRYQRAIVLPNSFKSALPVWFARIPVRSGYRGELRRGLLNDVRHLDEAQVPLLVERYAALAEAPGTKRPHPLPRPQLHADEAHRNRLVAALGLRAGTPVVAFCPGAEYGEAKRWPVEHYAQLAGRLAQEGLQVWLIGSPKDREIGAAITRLAAHEAVLDLCGRTTLADAVDLLSLATAVVSNDSGLMHVAAALERPLVALYGSSSPGYTPPLSSTSMVMNLSLSCSPCFQRTCPLGHLRCLRDITPEQVWEALKQQIPLASLPNAQARIK
jgi:heptosyltransferase II